MPHDGIPTAQNHSHATKGDSGSCCGGEAIKPTQVAASDGRSFHVSGLDCAEEVSILNRVVGPEVGGQEYLAFDVINARMTVPRRRSQPRLRTGSLNWLRLPG